MRLVFAGTPAVALPSLDALISSERHEVLAVVTRPDAPAGRGRALTESPVKQRATAAGIEVLTPGRPSEPDFLERLAQLAPDCVAVVAYGALVPEAALEIPTHGWVNLHFSVLPAWRGAAPVQHALLAGDDVTGATTFQLEAGLDTGPVYGVMTTTIAPHETAGELLDRLAVDGAGLLTATLDGIEDGSLTAEPQAIDGVSLAPKLKPGDARVIWTHPAAAVDRRIRACTPEPGAWTTFRGRRLGIGSVRIAADMRSESIPPGEVRDLGKDGVVVGTGSEPVRLGLVRPEGKPDRSAEEWARGARLVAGEHLE
ncbi:MAG: methionyl-tRNA formyltransferase [Mycobacteriales bacterium]